MTTDSLHANLAFRKQNPKKSTAEWRPETALWWRATNHFTPEQAGFAIAVLVLMRKTRRANLAAILDDVGSLAEDLNSSTATVARLRECFNDIPPEAVKSQLRAIATWPTWLVEEIAP